MKLKAEMSSFYGCDCMGCGYGSDESCDITINEELAEVVEREIDAHGGSLTDVEIRTLINDGVVVLKPLHENLWEKVVQMDIDYWLDQGDDGCGTIEDWMSRDMKEGRFVPKMSFEDYLKEHEIDITGEDYDEEDYRWEYENEVLDEEYRLWVSDLDQWDRAERYGLDLGVVIGDCRGKYTITIEKDN